METSASDEGTRSSVDDPTSPLEEKPKRTRKRAALAVLPFLGLGLADVVLILGWGMDPLWGFAILPPILFCSVLAWIVFSTDFLEDRT
jgi:hypothetical protein